MEFRQAPLVLKCTPGQKGWAVLAPGGQDRIDVALHAMPVLVFVMCPFCHDMMHETMAPENVVGATNNSMWCCHTCNGIRQIHIGFYGSRLPSGVYDLIRST